MNPLRSREVQAFSEALEQIYLEPKLDGLPQRIFQAIESLIPDVIITMDEFNLATGVARDAINRPPPAYREWRARLEAVVPIEHPSYHAILKGAKGVLAVSDFLSQRQLRDSALYSDVFRPLGCRYQLAIPLALPGHVAGVTIGRGAKFSETNLTVAALLAPHIALAYQHATALHSLAPHTTPEPAALQKIGLTPSEAEVLSWIIQGKRDGEIALILQRSPRTVHKHVERILAKLGTETRTDAAMEALRRSAPRAPSST